MIHILNSNDYFNTINEANSNVSSSVSLKDIPEDCLKDASLSPNLTAYKINTANLHVYDYPFLAKAATIIYNTLSNVKSVQKVIVDPLAVTINGVESAIIYTEKGTFTISHSTASTNINFYKGSDFKIGKNIVADFSVKTGEVGIRQSLLNLVEYIESIQNESLVNEAKDNKNYEAIANSPDLLTALQQCINNNRGTTNAAAKAITLEPEVYDQIFVGKSQPTINKWLMDLVKDGYLKDKNTGFSDTIARDVDTNIEDITDPETIEKVFEEERQKYVNSNDFIKRSVGRMCEYVKSKGRVIPPGFVRGLYIVGKAGSGKSYSTELTLEKYNMKQNKDYILWRNASSSVADLYDKFYEYNGKLIIMDDAAGVVNGETRVAFWKEVLQTKGGHPRLPQGTVSNDSKKYYEIGKAKNRKERYLMEMGDAEALVKKTDEYKKWERILKATSSDDFERSEAKAKMESLINKAKENAHPRVPDEFYFNGCVIVIGNCTELELQKKVVQSGGGNEDWKAINQRFGGVIVVAPPARVLWKQIRTNILSKANSTTPDCLLDIPREKTQWFVELVDSYMNGEKGAQFNDMSWRMPSIVGPLLREMDKNNDWEVRLESILRDSKYASDFNRSNPLLNKYKF